MSQTLRCACSTTAILAALIGPASAQTTPQTPPLSIAAPRLGGSITVPDAATAKEQLDQVPGATALVAADDIRNSRATTVKDVLDYVPGVFAQPKYGQEDSRLSIRGSGLSRGFHVRGVRMLRDGVPLNDADGGGDAQEIDPLAMDYAEIYKGANALRYGAASLGGAINFVSPTGRTQPGFLLRQELGSFDSARTQLGAGGVLGNFDYYLTPTYSHSDGYRDHTQQDYLRFNGNVGYRFAGNAETRFFLSAANINQKIVNNISKSEALNTPKAAFAANITNNSRRDIDSFRAANKTSFLTDSGEYTFGVFVANKNLLHPVQFNRFFGVVIDTDEVNGGGFARWSNAFDIAGHKNEATLGINQFNGVNHARQYANVRGREGALTSASDQKSNTTEIYGEDAYFVLPNVALVGGLQGSYATRKQEGKVGTTSFDESYASLNPKLGARWDLMSNTQVFTNLSWATEAPPFTELGQNNAALKAQKSTTLELGGRRTKGDLVWDAAVYRSWLRDELQNQTTATGSLDTNIDRTIHQGVELGGAWTFARNALATGDKTTARLAYTFSDFRFDGDRTFGNNEIPGAPRHYIRSEVRYDHRSGWYIAPNVEWIPQGYYADSANTVSTDPYALIGLKVGFAYSESLKFFADGRNLLNKAYISNVSTTNNVTTNADLFNPGDGRAVFVGVEMRW